MQTVQTYTSTPAFASAGSKVAPSAGAYSTGYLQGQRFPAAHANYFLGNLTANAVTEQSAIADTQTELGNFIVSTGIALNPATPTQLTAALQKGSGSLVNADTVDSLHIWQGTYSPTTTNYANMTGLSLIGTAHYIRIGNRVSVSATVTASTTLATTNTGFTISLPFSPTNNFSSGDVEGIAGTEVANGATMVAVNVNKTVTLHNSAGFSATGSHDWSCTFSYLLN